MVRFCVGLAFLSLLVGAAPGYARPQPPPPPEVEETLTKAREINGVRWPAGATLFFRADTKALLRGHVERLAAPWKVGAVTWPAGSYLDLDARGEVRSASRILGATETVGSVRWPAGTGLVFDGSGRIEFADRQSVAGETAGGYVFPAGAELRFNADGKLRSARVQGTDQVFASVRWKPTTLVQVAEDGQISALRTLQTSERIGKVHWPAGSTLILDARGEVLLGSFRAGKPMIFGGVLWPEHTELQVMADGKVIEANITSLPEAAVIGGKRYEAHLWIHFDPATGKVAYAHDPRDIE